MRAVLQRVKSASVSIKGKTAGAIGPGFLVLLGVAPEDTQEECDFLLDKILGLRVFEDEAGKMNRSLCDRGGALLVVSQFTLYADCRKGRRPSFTGAARPETAVPLYERFLAGARQAGVPTECGEFGADMLVSLENDGPVTILLDTDEIMPGKRARRE
mgnify:FL=1